MRSLTDVREYADHVPAAQHEGSIDNQMFARVRGDAADFVEPLHHRLQQEMPGEACAGAMTLDRWRCCCSWSH